MEDVILINEQHYILATSALTDERRRVLKNNESFAVFDPMGDIQPIGLQEQGIYHEGTRFLSRSVLTLENARPVLLSSAVHEDNAILSVDLTNADVCMGGQIVVPRGSFYLLRSKFLWQGVCYEAIRVQNYALSPIDVTFSISFDSDFVDIFEVRGARRERRGRKYPTAVEDGCIVLRYEGLDNIMRSTRIQASPPPQDITPEMMWFSVSLEPAAKAEFFVTITCESGRRAPAVLTYDAAISQETDALNRLRSKDCHIHTANEQFNHWLNRSAADLHMMVTNTPEILYPYAGVPWFSTPFGRDGIITALQYLWINPLIARGVLDYLADTQATEVNPAQDAEPGKIMHERREGEMAELGEHPFKRYYGSVDSTPLFVVLAGTYYERTGDLPFIKSIWPNIEAALSWIDNYGDADKDGFVEYARHSPTGLVQQGWKDSQDSVFHADGRLADPPIALCEVQGYVYAAKRRAAQLALALENPERANELLEQAAALQQQFEKAFWCEELSTYALALDGAKKACKVRASNAGHALFSGIASEEHARAAAATLLNADSFSGWGIRTVAAGQARYNPMSYHNGSVWPHDNSLIAYGLARYGRNALVNRVLGGLFDAALFVDQHRLPELFCGFGRQSGRGPTLYPVACSPQAWASGSAFLVLQAALGLSIQATERRISFHRALLPEFLPEVLLSNLSVGDACVDLLIERHAHNVSINVLERKGEVEIVTIK